MGPGPGAGTAGGEGSRRRFRRSQLTPYLFLIVPLGLLLLITYVPFLNMFEYSVLKWDGLSKDRTFVGLGNYIEFCTKPELFGVFFVSLYYVVGALIQIALALYLATVLSFK